MDRSVAAMVGVAEVKINGVGGGQRRLLSSLILY